MANNAELQRKLNQGVEAAKAGDHTTARRLLGEVVEQDDRNELAWIWLATVATGASERREHLRKVLSINPRNQRAREALARLGESLAPVAPTGRAALNQTPAVQDPVRRTSDALVSQPQRGGTGFIFIIAAAMFLLTGLGIIVFGSGVLSPEPLVITATPPAAAFVASSTPTEIPPPTLTATPIPAELVTRTAPTLLPTFTPTITPSPTPTMAFTPVLGLGAFEIYYIRQNLSSGGTELFSIQADGINEGLRGFDMEEIVFAADGLTLAFVRGTGESEPVETGEESADGGEDETGEVSPPEEPSSRNSSREIFVTTLADPAQVRQLTFFGVPDTSSPSFSPDGSMIVFSSSGDRMTPDLWVVPVDGGDPFRVMDTPAGEREPAWSPAGGQIAFTSDQEVSGSTEIFLVDVNESGQPIGSPYQATNARGNSYSPLWSADGSTIVFASDRTGDSDIYTMNAQGHNEQLVTLADGNAEDYFPSISSDGRWIIFISNREDGKFQTYVIRTDGTELQRLTNHQHIDLSAIFRPRPIEE